MAISAEAKRIIDAARTVAKNFGGSGWPDQELIQKAFEQFADQIEEQSIDAEDEVDG